MNMIPVSNAWYCRNFYSSFFGRARVPVVIEVIPPVELPKEPGAPGASRTLDEFLKDNNASSEDEARIKAQLDYWDQFQPQSQQLNYEDDSSHRLREQDYFEQLDLAPESRYPDRYGWDQYDRYQ
jgi:hypothetical protein